MDHEIVHRSQPATVRPADENLPPAPPRPPNVIEQICLEALTALEEAEASWRDGDPARANDLLRQAVGLVEPSNLADVITALMKTLARAQLGEADATDGFSLVRADLQAALREAAG